MTPIPTPSSSSSSSSSSVHDTTAIDSERTRRPPNAWILFRTQMAKDMSSPAPGQPALPQAEKSKIIAKMWREASAATKAFYEHLSDVAKEEHKLRHPNYRFKPMKRADKERLRAEKVAEKERARATRKARSRTRTIPHPVTPSLFTPEPRLSGYDMLEGSPSADHSTPSGHSQTPVDEYGCADLMFAPLLSQDLSQCMVAPQHPPNPAQHSAQHLVPNPVQQPIQNPPPMQQMGCDYTDPSLAFLVNPTDNPLFYIYGTGDLLDGQQPFDDSCGMKFDHGSFIGSDADAYGTIDAFDATQGTSNLETMAYNQKAWEELLAFLDAANPQQHTSHNAAGQDQSNMYHVAPLHESSNVNAYLADDPS